MINVANIPIDGGIDVPQLIGQLAWLAKNGIRIPTWLSVLASEDDKKSTLFGRTEAVGVGAFIAFRNLLCERYAEARTTRAVPAELEGLMSLFDYLYDEITALTQPEK